MKSQNLSDAQWQRIEKYFTETNRSRKHSLRKIFDSIFYLLKTGCQWRLLPVNYPKWELVYHYVYESGREGDAPLVGFSPRKDAFALYLSSQLKDREALLEKFGKHKTAKACVYIKKLSDIDVEILKKLVTNSIERIKNLYP